MKLENFQFSQASLQDYSECPRRFQLRYLQKLSWPAIETEPLEEQEKRIQLGSDFHRLVQQHLTGMPQEDLERAVVDTDLERWWRNYKVYRPYALPGDHYPEMTLTMPVAEHRLVAKYDLLVVDAGKHITILDWKTTLNAARVAQLLKRMQTRVYRYVLVHAGTHLFAGSSVKPDDITMIYWFPEYPESPALLPYSHTDYAADHQVLTNLIDEISSLADNDFHMTADRDRCDYCRYRSYCGTSECAGKIASYEDEKFDDDMDIDLFDFEQIAEIEF